MEQSVQIKINVPESMRDDLRLRAVAEDCSVSALIRRAVRLAFYADAQSKNQPTLLVAKDGHK